MDTVGKVFMVDGEFRRCLVCDDLFTREASREHSAATCFPPPISGTHPVGAEA